jgi:hypothetical protein
MNSRKPQDLPAPLERVQRRFQQWRKLQKARARIPDSLWDAAVKMAGKYGLCRTARALPVEYYSLKKRIEQQSIDQGTSPLRVQGIREVSAAASFVEWSPALHAGPCDCTLELEDADGSKMRVHLKTAAAPDLAALCRSFRNPAL